MKHVFGRKKTIRYILLALDDGEWKTISEIHRFVFNSMDVDLVIGTIVTCVRELKDGGDLEVRVRENAERNSNEFRITVSGRRKKASTEESEVEGGYDLGGLLPA